MAEKILEVENLKMHFPLFDSSGFMKKVSKVVKAVDNVSFTLNRFETLGLVGESGCGKTTTGRNIVRLYEPTGGKMLYHSERQKEKGVVDLSTLSAKEMLAYRSEIQMVFQDPVSSLDPHMSVFDIIAEPLMLQKVANRFNGKPPSEVLKEFFNNRFKGKNRGVEFEEQVIDALNKVNLNPDYRNRFPHEFSGGQRQRIGIARSIIMNPSLIVCDEPVSALDVSVQAQVVNLFLEMKEAQNLSYIFIAHDLNIVRYISDRIAVMYMGQIIEIADTDTLFNNLKHPYTESLLGVVPIPDPKKRGTKKILRGEVTENSSTSTGCNFAPRCSYAESVCFNEEPAVSNVEGSGKGHQVKCHFHEKLNLSSFGNREK